MSQPPMYFQKMKDQYPAVFESYEALGKAARSAGPLDEKTATLIKLALSIGAALEGASHGNARKAIAAGCTPDELRHVAMLAITTLGFPSMMRARAWVEDVIAKE